MVIPIKFPDDGFVAKTPTAPELSPIHQPALLPGDDGIFLKLGICEDIVFVRRSLYGGDVLGNYFHSTFNNITPGETYILPYISKDNFEIIVKCIESGSINFKTLQQALEILQTSVTITYPTLCREAVSHIDLNLTSDNLLEVMETIIPIYLRLTSSVKWDSDFFLKPGVENRLEVKSYIYALVTNCEIISSGCAEKILSSKRFQELNRELAINILMSMDLYIFNEMVLFNVISNWSRKELADRTNEEKRKEIGRDIIFVVRYGLMSEEEFLEGPAKSGLLLPNEIDVILKYIRNVKKKVKLPKDYSYMKNFSVPRVKYGKCPFKLSSRTINGCTHFCMMRNDCESLKNDVKKDKNPPKVLCVFLRCWQILFD